MVEKPRRSPAVRVSRAATGERLGGFLYGTIIVLAVVVAGAKAYPHEAGKIAALVAVTSVVFGSHTSMPTVSRAPSPMTNTSHWQSCGTSPGVKAR